MLYGWGADLLAKGGICVPLSSTFTLRNMVFHREDSWSSEFECWILTLIISSMASQCTYSMTIAHLNLTVQIIELSRAYCSRRCQQRVLHNGYDDSELHVELGARNSSEAVKVVVKAAWKFATVLQDARTSAQLRKYWNGRI